MALHVFRASIDVALDRLLGGRAKLKYQEVGMGLGLSRDLVEVSAYSKAEYAIYAMRESVSLI